MSNIFCLPAQTHAVAFPSFLTVLTLQRPHQTLSTQTGSSRLLFLLCCTVLLPPVVPRYLMNWYFRWRLDLFFLVLEGRNHVLVTFCTYILNASPSGSALTHSPDSTCMNSRFISIFFSFSILVTTSPITEPLPSAWTVHISPLCPIISYLCFIFHLRGLPWPPQIGQISLHLQCCVPNVWHNCNFKFVY